MTMFTTETVQQLFEFWWLGPLILVDLVAKGFGLWHAAKRGQKTWFIAILVVNSLAILPLIYLFLVARIQNGTTTGASPDQSGSTE